MLTTLRAKLSCQTSQQTRHEMNLDISDIYVVVSYITSLVQKRYPNHPLPSVMIYAINDNLMELH